MSMKKKSIFVNFWGSKIAIVFSYIKNLSKFCLFEGFPWKKHWKSFILIVTTFAQVYPGPTLGCSKSPQHLGPLLSPFEHPLDDPNLQHTFEFLIISRIPFYLNILQVIHNLFINVFIFPISSFGVPTVIPVLRKKCLLIFFFSTTLGQIWHW